MFRLSVNMSALGTNVVCMSVIKTNAYKANISRSTGIGKMSSEEMLLKQERLEQKVLV
jgi:hypothetical protein